MNDALENCPFCGNIPEMMKTELKGFDPDECYWVKCDACDVSQEGIYKYEIAISKWNKRVKS